MNKAILKTIGKRGNQNEINNENDLDYSIFDDYYPKARPYYETPFQHLKDTSVLNNHFNFNNNLLNNKNQLKSLHLNKDSSPLLTTADEQQQQTANRNRHSDNNQIVKSQNSQGNEKNKSDNKIADPHSSTYLDELNVGNSEDNPSSKNFDDNDLQLKYLYSLYRNRFDNF